MYQVNITDENDKITTYNVPENWDEVTLKQFQKYALYILHKGNNGEEFNLEQLIQITEFFTEIPRTMFEKMDAVDGTLILQNIGDIINTKLDDYISQNNADVLTFTHNDVIYKRILSLNELKTIHFLNIHSWHDNYNKAEDKTRYLYQYLHRIIALSYIPIDKIYTDIDMDKHEKEIKNVSVTTVYSTINFFLSFLEILSINGQLSSKMTEQMTNNLINSHLENLKNQVRFSDSGTFSKIYRQALLNIMKY